MKKEVKWVSLENESGTATLKRHGFIPDERVRRYTGEKYIGNISLCGKVFADDGNGDGEVGEFSSLTCDGFNANITCKKCLKIWNGVTGEVNS